MKKSFKIILLVLCGITLTIFGGLLSLNLSIGNIKLDNDKLINLEHKISYYDNSGKVFAEESNGISITNDNEIPINTKNAFIAIEDKRFYSHNGIDYRGLARAAFNNLRSLSLKEGASTISQQLIKNTHLSNEKTFKRKLKEIKLTKQLEKEFSKEEILEKYLNTIYFGDNCYGITAAAKHYFDKTPAELDLNESAILAAIIKAPNNYSPINNVEKCRIRKNLVLKEMFNQGYILKSEYEQCRALPIQIKTSTPKKEYDFLYLARNEATEILQNSPYEFLNTKIYTEYNENYNSIIKEKLAEFDTFDCDKSVILMNKYGKILSYYSTCGDLPRQLGSVIKPIAVYAPAIEYDVVNSYTVLLDEKTNFNGYAPSNYNDKYYGNISVKDSLAKSSNICAVKLLNYLTVDKAIKFIKSTDIPISNNDATLSLALGATKAGAKLTQITAAYNIFSNSGIYTTPNIADKICSNNDNIIYKNNDKGKKILQNSTTSVMNDMLENVVEAGTAKKLNFADITLYGKTGTVGTDNGNSDAYIISYNKDYTLGVWFGSKSGQLMSNDITGGSIPSILASEIWKEIYKNRTVDTKIEYSDTTEIYIDKISYEEEHRVVVADQNAPERYKIKAIFKNNSLPKEQSTRFSTPKIQNPKISVNNNKIKIELCQTELYDFLIYRYLNGEKELAYDSKNNNKYFNENLKHSSVYQYSIIPYYDNGEKIFYGKEIFSEKIKTPNKKFGDGWWEDDFN